ncbi:MAG: TonB-dependent receptor family protein [Chitinophagaceae bacterium]
MMKKILIFVISGVALTASAQNTEVNNIDTLPATHKYLEEVTIVGRASKSDYHQMPEVVGTSIYAGKKNALIVLDNVQGNVVTNNMRQVLAKVPGIHIWESDPSGIQIGIAARGLSPNRSWEFNVRQNGYDISADPFGYPEAYYNPQLQAVQRIEVVRGAGSLQYGPQFGGLVNYILRNGSEMNKKFEFETQQTIGSNNLFNSYNAIGGNTDKIHYYTFFDHRNGKGWRQNSRYYTNAGYGTVTYRFTSKFSLTAELMHSHIRTQQPGGLTDIQFAENAQQSLRNRNWFDITWTTPAVIANYYFNDKARLNTKIFGVIGDRNSVGFLQSVTIKDSINLATGTYNNRTVQLDQYRNYGLESRYLSDYSLGAMNNTFSGGIRIYTGSTYRRADGKGSTGANFDVTVIGNFPKDITYKSKNAAIFVENIFRLGEKFLIVPGIRYEWLQAQASGRNGFANTATAIILQNQKRSRGFLLAGIGAEYHIGKTEFYSNFTQAYRPMQFADLTTPPTTDIVDPDLRDAKGYNVDFGHRGKVRNYLQFDVSGFYLQYNNRIGVISQQRQDSSFYNFRTNVGNSTSKGIESYIEFNPVRGFTTITNADLILFTSYGYTNARYGSLKVITKQGNNLLEANLKNKKVENAPEHILRAGITTGYKGFLITGQISHVSEAFADANNTITPTANGQNGLIPSYTITDLTATYKFSKILNIKAGVNNLFDERYFTRRAGGYPGPGLLPADGRTFFVSVGAKF